MPPCRENHFYQEHARLIRRSFEKLLNKPLLAEISDKSGIGEALYFAPFAVVSHDTKADPVFNYANAKALELFEMSWEEFISTPSRLSAEPVNQDERNRLLALVSTQGYINDYQGVRISKHGRRFMIKNAVVWNLLDEDGIYRGQAAFFDEWLML
ncbi:MEKHLA domain-containing protein [Methylicorpusculum oleiharenae]|uniref:MEKHLA domain-containing protein n=1 Tax=Methylicorpusculum oleiharenae TaxID=1338687 RepID=UPI001356F004|nr:MEKHLA domain-containing protein [Methylicorpusculum oleiharenae]MCD2450726.1 MEKHLA domain-containing protein [Methylicorpusculum oleiharenae]